MRAYTLVSACTHMHLDPREFACIHTHKLNGNTVSCVRLHACIHTHKLNGNTVSCVRLHACVCVRVLAQV